MFHMKVYARVITAFTRSQHSSEITGLLEAPIQTVLNATSVEVIQNFR